MPISEEHTDTSSRENLATAPESPVPQLLTEPRAVPAMERALRRVLSQLKKLHDAVLDTDQDDDSSEDATKKEPQRLRNEWITKDRTRAAAARAVVRTLEEFIQKFDTKGSEHLLLLADLKKIKSVSPNPERVERLISLLAAERLRVYTTQRVLSVLAEGGLTATTLVSANSEIAKLPFLASSTLLQLDIAASEANMQELITSELREILTELTQVYYFEFTKGMIPDFSQSTAQDTAKLVGDTEKVYPFLYQIAPALTTQLSAFMLTGHKNLAGLYAAVWGGLYVLNHAKLLQKNRILQGFRNQAVKVLLPVSTVFFEDSDQLLPYFFLVQRYAPNMSMKSEVKSSRSFMRTVRETVERLQTQAITLCTPEQHARYREKMRSELLDRHIETPLAVPHELTEEKRAVLPITEYTHLKDVTPPREHSSTPNLDSLKRRTRAILTGNQIQPIKAPEQEYAVPLAEKLQQYDQPTLHLAEQVLPEEHLPQHTVSPPQLVVADFCMYLLDSSFSHPDDMLLLESSSFATEPGKLLEIWGGKDQIARALAQHRQATQGALLTIQDGQVRHSATTGLDTQFYDLSTLDDDKEYARQYFTNYPLDEESKPEEFTVLQNYLCSSGLLTEDELTTYLTRRSAGTTLSGGYKKLRFKLQLLDACMSNAQIVVLHGLFDKFKDFAPEFRSEILRYLTAQAQTKTIMINRPVGVETITEKNPDFAQFCTRLSVDEKTKKISGYTSLADVYALFEEFSVPYSVPDEYVKTAPQVHREEQLSAEMWLGADDLHPTQHQESAQRLYREVVERGTTLLHRKPLKELREQLAKTNTSVQLPLPDAAHDDKEVLYKERHSVAVDLVFVDSSGKKLYLIEEAQQDAVSGVKYSQMRRGLSMRYNPKEYPASRDELLPVALIQNLIDTELSTHTSIPLTRETVKAVQQESVFHLDGSDSIPSHEHVERFEVEIGQSAYDMLMQGFASLSTARTQVGKFRFEGER